MHKKISDFWYKIKPYILPYAVAIAIPTTVGIIAAALTRDSMDIYDTLKVPPFAPPGILFPIVWTLLYVFMGVSSALVFIDRELAPYETRKGFLLYGASLILNFSWSIIFFKLQASFFALLVLGVLLYTIIKTIIEYYKVKPLAAFLQIPYALWVGFAGYLNTAIWLLN